MTKRLCIGIICFSTVLSIPVFAQEELSSPPLSLSLGGYMRWYGTYADFFDIEGFQALQNENVNHFDVMGDAEIYFMGTTQLENGIKLGVTAQLKAGTEPVKVFDEVYMTVEGTFGRFQAGNVKNTAYQMSVVSPTVSFIGVQESSYNRFGVFGLLGKSAEATYPTWDDISTKLNYISPSINCFSVGVSLMPSNNGAGEDNTVLVNNKVFQYGASATLLYQQRFGNNDDWLVAASASYAQYKPRESFTGTHRFIRDISVGLNIGYGNLTVGGSVKRELSPVNTMTIGENFSDAQGYVYDAGVSYDTGAYGISVNYIGAQTRNTAFSSDKNTSDLVVAAAKYRLGAGVNVFMDVSYANVDTAAGAKAKGIGSAAGFDVMF